MRLAIDVGNSQTVFGLHDGSDWVAHWRRDTSDDGSDCELEALVSGWFSSVGLPLKVDQALCVSVVTAAEAALVRLSSDLFGLPLQFLRVGPELDLKIVYDPPTAVGADRIANAIGALAKYAPPVLVIDFGTATTFDAVSAEGAFVGGAIMPGLGISADALFTHAPGLPRVEFAAPLRACGRNTVEALQSGIMLGYAGGVESLAGKIAAELGESRIIATGGLGSLFMGLCPSISAYEPTLTLDGLLATFKP